MLTPCSGSCATPLHRGRVGQPGGLEHGRGDVDDVVELVCGRCPAFAIPGGQWTTVALRVPPQCDATCLVHW